MKNAIPEIKAVAKYIRDRNDNLGVAKAINHVINDTMDEMINISDNM